MFSKFIYVIACIRTSYIFIISIPLYGNTTHCLILSINNKFIHSSGWWRVVSTLWLLWVILLWTFLYRILCKHVFGSVGYMYLAVDCGSDGDANVLRNCQLFRSGCTVLHSHGQCIKTPPFCFCSLQVLCCSGLSWKQFQVPGVPWALCLDKQEIFRFSLFSQVCPTRVYVPGLILGVSDGKS